MCFGEIRIQLDRLLKGLNGLLVVIVQIEFFAFFHQRLGLALHSFGAGLSIGIL